MALDAVVRHGSVTTAAAELSLTQSTVSRLILTLEDQLGAPLFIRERRRLIPTAAALSYQADIARALDIIQRASMSVVANPDGGTLSLAVLPTFASRWLGPRLPHFLTGHPGISVNMSTRIGRVDFSGDAFDAAVSYCGEIWSDCRKLKLFDERVTACASPEFLNRHRIEQLGDLAALPKLQLESRPNVWNDWFAGQGGTTPVMGGMLTDQFSMMIQAAISGLGVALLPDYLAEIEIAEGRLLPLFKRAVPTTGAYWFVWPDSKDKYLPLFRFRKWIAEQAIEFTPDGAN